MVYSLREDFSRDLLQGGGRIPLPSNRSFVICRTTRPPAPPSMSPLLYLLMWRWDLLLSLTKRDLPTLTVSSPSMAANPRVTPASTWVM